MILNTILQIFTEDLDFLSQVWLNLEFIGAIYEGNNIPIYEKKPKGFIMKDDPLEPEVFLEKFEKALNKELQDHVRVVSKTIFNREIQKKLVKIKGLALDYANETFNKFVLRLCPREFLESKISLFKIFLMNTFDENLIQRICRVLEQIKAKYPGLIKNLSFFEQQITDSKFIFVFFILRIKKAL